MDREAATASSPAHDLVDWKDARMAPFGEEQAAMRAIRNLLSSGIPFLGMVIVFSGILVVHDLQTQIIVVLLGVLLIEAGVWKLTSPLLPSERRYTELRDEVDRFIGLVRQLNTEALTAHGTDSADDWARVEGVKQTMHAAVERMVELAGREDGATSTPTPPAVAPSAQPESEGEETQNDGPTRM